MNCSLCKRREASVRMECTNCWKKYFACSVCAMDWKGKLTHCGKLLTTTGYLGGSKAVRPLDELLREACERTSKFSAKMSLAHLEILIGEPSTIIATGSTANLKEVLKTFAINKTVEWVQNLTVAQYIDFLVEHHLYSGSCGATSGWLESITRKSGLKADMLTTQSSGLLTLLEGLDDVPTWYCRVTREPHSFFIECINGTARIYQSYFSKYGLAHSVEEVRPFPIAELLTLLRQTLLGAGVAAQELTRKKRLLYLCDVGWRDTVVKYSLNQQPAESATVAKHITARLAESRENWQALLSKKLSTELPPEVAVEDVDDSVSTVTSPQTVTCKWTETGGYMQLQGGEIQQAPAGQLPIGTVLDSWYPDEARYRVSAVRENEYTLTRV